MVISVYSIIGKSCITLEQGENVFEIIDSYLEFQQKVTLDFKDVLIFSALFFAECFGKLYDKYEIQLVEELLLVQNLGEVGSKILNLVKQNAKKYYTDPEHKKAVDKIIQNFSEEYPEPDFY